MTITQESLRNVASAMVIQAYQDLARLIRKGVIKDGKFTGIKIVESSYVWTADRVNTLIDFFAPDGGCGDALRLLGLSVSPAQIKARALVAAETGRYMEKIEL